MKSTDHRFLPCLVLLFSTTSAPAQAPRIDPAGIDGALLLCGGYDVAPATFEQFVDLAGGAKAKIVFLIADKAKWSAPPLEGMTAATKKKNAAEPTVADY